MIIDESETEGLHTAIGSELLIDKIEIVRDGYVKIAFLHDKNTDKWFSTRSFTAIKQIQLIDVLRGNKCVKVKVSATEPDVRGKRRIILTPIAFI